MTDGKTTLICQANVIKMISSHAQKEYPRECCGIMLGKRTEKQRTVSQIIPTKNIVEESRNTTHFLINPLELFKAERIAEEKELDIVGFYHSHPDGEAVASKEDFFFMLTGYSYLILSLQGGRYMDANSFEKIRQEHTTTKEKEEILEEIVFIKEK